MPAGRIYRMQTAARAGKSSITNSLHKLSSTARRVEPAKLALALALLLPCRAPLPALRSQNAAFIHSGPIQFKRPLLPSGHARGIGSGSRVLARLREPEGSRSGPRAPLQVEQGDET